MTTDLEKAINLPRHKMEDMPLSELAKVSKILNTGSTSEYRSQLIASIVKRQEGLKKFWRK